MPYTRYPARMTTLVPVRRALISVSDKSGLLDLARVLIDARVEIISTGGTAAALAKAGIPVTPIDALTGFPEIMDGRVKTLHPKVHGGLLAVRDNPEHDAAMKAHEIAPIDLVCVNLYPFEATVAKPGVSRDEAIENIDIGGPSMIRSAAKNHRFVAVLTDPSQYAEFIAEFTSSKGVTTLALRERLAAAAYARTSAYDLAITTYLSVREDKGDAALLNDAPESSAFNLELVESLRYGENPHQKSRLYRVRGDAADLAGSLATARKLHGKELSYNNINDAAAALELVRQLSQVDPSRVGACVVKHMNPCGAALASNPLDAVNAAIAGDPLAAFGGILAINKPLDLRAAKRLCEKDIFMEVIVGPGFAPEAVETLKARWTNLRLLDTGPLAPLAQGEIEWRSLPGPGGGWLAQERDTHLVPSANYEHKAGPAPTAETLGTAAFLEPVCRALLSNAVCLGGPSESGGMRLFGAGAGQMDRLTSCRLATEKAGPLSKGSVAYSDAFFPFPDGPTILIDAGVTTILHPGGSKRDQETFDLCNARGVTCLLTGVRHFRH
jgi:phosphoribosylaminoimidazolecarboxamide formyltransferase/IMP cyclohydrolase